MYEADLLNCLSSNFWQQKLDRKSTYVVIKKIFQISPTFLFYSLPPLKFFIEPIDQYSPADLFMFVFLFVFVFVFAFVFVFEFVYVFVFVFIFVFLSV